MDSWAQYWERIAIAATATAKPDNTRDTAAVLAAWTMVNTFRSHRRIPQPTPELSAQLSWAEVLAA